jgi:hypothetical protein
MWNETHFAIEFSLLSDIVGAILIHVCVCVCVCVCVRARAHTPID